MLEIVSLKHKLYSRKCTNPFLENTQRPRQMGLELSGQGLRWLRMSFKNNTGPVRQVKS